ncbi:MAG: hypothetical protein OEZ02_04520 [Anaerolineae bacterium]|nr:hypothetical protein [Anaerolineae bacterium]
MRRQPGQLFLAILVHVAQPLAIPPPVEQVVTGVHISLVQSRPRPRLPATPQPLAAHELPVRVNEAPAGGQQRAHFTQEGQPQRLARQVVHYRERQDHIIAVRIQPGVPIRSSQISLPETGEVRRAVLRFRQQPGAEIQSHIAALEAIPPQLAGNLPAAAAQVQYARLSRHRLQDALHPRLQALARRRKRFGKALVELVVEFEQLVCDFRVHKIIIGD